MPEKADEVTSESHIECCGGTAGMLKGPARALPPPKARADPGPRPGRKMKSFFWDKLPDNRIEGTFWAAHQPAYSCLNIPEVNFAPIHVCAHFCPALGHHWKPERLSPFHASAKQREPTLAHWAIPAPRPVSHPREAVGPCQIVHGLLFSNCAQISILPAQCEIVGSGWCGARWRSSLRQCSCRMRARRSRL